jgi:CheY-like chemotaxis protein
MHGGTVEAHSDGVGKGAVFTVTLPCDPAPEPTAAAPSPTAGSEGTRSQRVLIVDDNVDAAETLAELIGLWGHEVQIVHDGGAALAAVAGFRPSLILLDLGLPGMDGYEVARRLAGTEARSTARLVAVTGYAGEEHRRRTTELGFDAHFGKPLEPEVLKRYLAEL